jgi:hypothetical protein
VLTDGLALKVFLKLTLRLTWAKYQNRVRTTQGSDDLVKEFTEMSIKPTILSVSPDLRGVSMGSNRETRPPYPSRPASSSRVKDKWHLDFQHSNQKITQQTKHDYRDKPETPPTNKKPANKPAIKPTITYAMTCSGTK